MPQPEEARGSSPGSSPRHRCRWTATGIAGLVLLLAGPLAGLIAPGQVGLVSTRDPSLYAAGGENPSTSADGRYIVFDSIAINLVTGLQGPHTANIYLLDRVAGTMTLVSHTAGDPLTRAGGDSLNPVLSADGRYVVFHSLSTDLVPGFIRRHTFGGDGDLFLYDRLSGLVTLITGSTVVAGGSGDGESANPTVSADGRFIAFHSLSTDLVPGQVDPSHQTSDVFLYDRTTATTLLLSHQSGSPVTAANWISYFPQVSADGRFVVFESGASDLVAGVTDANSAFDVFLYDRTTGTTVLLSHGASTLTAGNGDCFGPLISADGNFVTWNSSATDLVPGQVGTNGTYDVVLYDRQAGATTLVSHAAGSPLQEASGESKVGAISADGRYLAFSSTAANLVPGQVDANGVQDAFLYDRVAGTTVLVSHTSAASLASGDDLSSSAAISADGRFLFFFSRATNLVPGQSDAAGTMDLFVYDIAAGTAGTTALVSHDSTSATTTGQNEDLFIPLAISADGSFLAFASNRTDLDPDVLDRNPFPDLFLYDRAAGTNSTLTVGLVTSTSATPTGTSTLPGPLPAAMSADGRFLVFKSDAPDVVPGVRDFNGSDDLFLYDRATGTKTLVSHVLGSPDPSEFGGSEEAVVSPDGHYVAFASGGLIEPGEGVLDGNVFLYDRLAATTTLVSHAVGLPDQVANAGSHSPAESADGRYVAFLSNATNLLAGFQFGAAPAVFLYDRVSGTTTLVSHHAANPLLSGDLPSARPVLSADGRYLAYASQADDLAPGQIDLNGIADVFLYDRTTGVSTLVSQGADGAAASGDQPVMSADGRYVAYVSAATHLVPGQVDGNGGSDVFLYDQVTGTTTLVSQSAASALTAGNGTSDSPSLSADGRLVAFASAATDLFPGQTDGNGKRDVFVYDRVTGTTTLASRSTASASTSCNQGADHPVLSADGGALAFVSAATDLVAGQDPAGAVANVFLFDRVSGRIALASTNGVGSATAGNGDSGNPLLAADGSWVAFSSFASDLVGNDVNGLSDVFLFQSPFTGRAFFTLPPCRLLDTRQLGQGPALSSGSPRVLPAHGACGIPATARAIVANITLTQPTAAGHLTIFPADTGLPSTSTLNFGPGQTRANNAILLLSLDGAGTVTLSPVVTGAGTVHVIVDVSGYFE